MPIVYFVLMLVSGAALSVLGHNQSTQTNAVGSPFLWLLGLALIYELTQKFVPALKLTVLTPMQRFAGFFCGAILYFLLMRFA